MTLKKIISKDGALMNSTLSDFTCVVIVSISMCVLPPCHLSLKSFRKSQSSPPLYQSSMLCLPQLKPPILMTTPLKTKQAHGAGGDL